MFMRRLNVDALMLSGQSAVQYFEEKVHSELTQMEIWSREETQLVSQCELRFSIVVFPNVACKMAWKEKF